MDVNCNGFMMIFINFDYRNGPRNLGNYKC